jgi:plastocyanin
MRLCISIALLLASAACPAFGGAVSVHLTDADGSLLADAVISLHGGPVEFHGTPPVAVLEQRDLQFSPSVLAIRVGTEVSFPNLDRVAHHVYSFSETRRFELRLYRGTPDSPVRFQRPGTVVLGCNIHDWMLAYIHVVDSPWFEVADGVQTPRIEDVPAGSYELRVWHPRLRGEAARHSQMIQVGASEDVRLEMALEVDPPDPRFLSPKQRAEAAR